MAISYTAPNISPITQRKTFSLLRRLIVRAWAACVMSDRNCLETYGLVEEEVGVELTVDWHLIRGGAAIELVLQKAT